MLTQTYDKGDSGTCVGPRLVSGPSLMPQDAGGTLHATWSGTGQTLPAPGLRTAQLYNNFATWHIPGRGTQVAKQTRHLENLRRQDWHMQFMKAQGRCGMPEGCVPPRLVESAHDMHTWFGLGLVGWPAVV
jgi:hypothetical protein